VSSLKLMRMSFSFFMYAAFNGFFVLVLFPDLVSSFNK
jgi:hypothetical protein